MNPLILIAEDDPEIADILDAYLAHDGFRSYRVDHGHTRSTWLRPEARPDPARRQDAEEGRLGSPYELRRRSDTPIVIITALDREIDRLQGLRFGADDYHHETVQLAEVVARIRAIRVVSKRPRPAASSRSAT